MQENRFFAQRHGRSFANELGILLSNLEDGVSGFGLTEEGRKQVTLAAKQAQQNGLGKDRPLVFVVSPFLRAVETARISQSILGGFIVIDEKLKERFFGRYDKKSDGNLQHIWQRDEIDDQNTEGDVESPVAVRQRIAAVIQDVQENFEECDIILVSHGDTLQIAETFFSNMPAATHRRLPHLHNAEIRELHLRTTSKSCHS